MLRSSRVERHHLEINRVMPIVRAADQQRYRLVSVMRQVEAAIDACLHAIVMQQDVEIFDGSLLCFRAVMRSQHMAESHALVGGIRDNKSQQLYYPAVT